MWKRMMLDSWHDLQDFIAMLALPDEGANTAKFQKFEEAWDVLKATYTSNVNRAFGAMEGEGGSGGLAADVAARQAEVGSDRASSLYANAPADVCRLYAHGNHHLNAPADVRRLYAH